MAILHLPHIIGVSRALEMMLSGELVDAVEAEKIGLVKKIVPADKLMDEARTLAKKLMKGAPLAQQGIKRSVFKALRDPAGLAEFPTPLMML